MKNEDVVGRFYISIAGEITEKGINRYSQAIDLALLLKKKKANKFKSVRIFNEVDGSCVMAI